MSYEALTVRPANPRLGAYVSGVNIAAPLTNRAISELHQALAE